MLVPAFAINRKGLLSKLYPMFDCSSLTCFKLSEKTIGIISFMLSFDWSMALIKALG